MIRDASERSLNRIAKTPASRASLPAYISPSAARSRNMAAVKRSNTKPEIALRHALHAVGLRYRKDYPLRLGCKLIRPDIAFTRSRVAVFVDGCFWHRCPQHGEVPATNVGFWSAKLEANAARDRQQDRLLAEAGWLVVRIWEHEPLDAAIATVRAALTSRVAVK
jgi:DNA mismatch endonuclease (patch repair protein)